MEELAGAPEGPTEAALWILPPIPYPIAASRHRRNAKGTLVDFQRPLLVNLRPYRIFKHVSDPLCWSRIQGASQMTPRQKTSVSARCLSIQNLAVNSRVIDGLVGLARILGTGENYRPKFGPANILLLKNCAQYYGLHHLSKPPVDSLYPLRSLFHISQYSTAPPFSPAAGLGGGEETHHAIEDAIQPMSQPLSHNPDTGNYADALPQDV